MEDFDFKFACLHSIEDNVMTVTPICKVTILRYEVAKTLSLAELERYVSLLMPYWGDKRINPMNSPVQERIIKYSELRDRRSEYDNKKELLLAIYGHSFMMDDTNPFKPY